MATSRQLPREIEDAIAVIASLPELRKAAAATGKSKPGFSEMTMVVSMRPTLRRKIAEGYTLRQLYDVLNTEGKVACAFETFKAYVYHSRYSSYVLPASAATLHSTLDVAQSSIT